MRFFSITYLPKEVVTILPLDLIYLGIKSFECFVHLFIFNLFSFLFLIFVCLLVPFLFSI